MLRLIEISGIIVGLKGRETNQMTNEEKGRAIQMFLQGISHRKVADELGYSKTCNTNLFQRFCSGTMKPIDKLRTVGIVTSKPTK